MLDAAAPALNIAFGIAGVALCLLNYGLLTCRPPGRRTGVLFALNHVALASMATGLAIWTGFAWQSLALAWTLLALVLLRPVATGSERNVSPAS